MTADASEEQSPYGSGSRPQQPSTADAPRAESPAVPGRRPRPPPPPAAPATTGAPSPRRVRIPHLHAMKAEGRRWAMLTAYDMYAAQIFDEAGIPVLLVGDSAGNNV